MLTFEEIREIADAELQPILAEAGYESVDISPKLNDDGESALLVTVHFRRNAPKTDGKPTSLARLALKRALERAGDDRFPHFRYDFRGEDTPSETASIGR